MYRITFFKTENEQDNYIIYCERIEHIDILKLDLKNIKDEQDNFHNVWQNYDEFSIHVLNNNNHYNDLIMYDDLFIDDCWFYNNDINLDMKNNWLAESFYNAETFKYLELIKQQKSRMWLAFNEEEKGKWLSACMNYNSEQPKFNTEITIEGNIINSVTSFYCEFAEQLIGIGGYFGTNLDAFDDCLYGYYDNLKGVTVTWNDFDICDFKDKDIVLEIINNHAKRIKLIKN